VKAKDGSVQGGKAGQRRIIVRSTMAVRSSAGRGGDDTLYIRALHVIDKASTR
jgi:hypothetical protein